MAQRVLLGHDDKGAPISEPHMAVLPLPSLFGPYPDGRIRRVALIGFACAEDPNRRAIVEMARVLLSGLELLDNGRSTGVKLETEPAGQWLRAIIQRARTWVTVTPMVQVAKELTSAEWKRLVAARRAAEQAAAELARLEERLRARRLALVTRSFMQATAARPVAIEVVSGGPVAGVHVAQQYRVSGYLGETPRFHLRVTFDRPVAGPIAVGRGRHVGFGLLWPEVDPFRTP